VRALRSEAFATFVGSVMAAAFGLAVGLLIVGLSGESASEAADAFLE
jgi:hypothetical protein